MHNVTALRQRRRETKQNSSIAQAFEQGDLKGISINVVDHIGALFVVSGGCVMVMVIPIRLLLLSLLIAVDRGLLLLLLLVPG